MANPIGPILVGDRLRMADLRSGAVIDVVAVTGEQNGKVVVEREYGPRQQWKVGVGFLVVHEDDLRASEQ